MESMLNRIIELILPQNDVIIYLFLFASAVVENIFPPIPGDTVTVLGAFLVGTGRLEFVPVYLATTFGSTAGFMLLVFLGRALMREFFIKKDYKFFSARSIVRAEAWFARYGYLVVLSNRFLPGIRSVISITAGITRLELSKVFFLSLASSALWNFLWILVGFFLGNNWRLVRKNAAHFIRQYDIAAGIVIGVAIAGIIVYQIIRRRRSSPDNHVSS
jgi:membrane protein DedA with SNARE-associated domain